MKKRLLILLSLLILLVACGESKSTKKLDISSLIEDLKATNYDSIFELFDGEKTEVEMPENDFLKTRYVSYEKKNFGDLIAKPSITSLQSDYNESYSVFLKFDAKENELSIKQLETIILDEIKSKFTEYTPDKDVQEYLDDIGLSGPEKNVIFNGKKLKTKVEVSKTKNEIELIFR